MMALSLGSMGYDASGSLGLLEMSDDLLRCEPVGWRTFACWAGVLIPHE